MLLKLYHGSPNIVQRPEYGKGKPYNDYGAGFYMTEHSELAGEWAVADGTDGFINEYKFEAEGLNVLKLDSDNYTALNWLAILADNRRFRDTSPVMKRSKQWLLDNYLIDLDPFDLIIGYRADDSYFSFARAFLENTITLEQLSLAMKLGKLGEQFVIRSRAAFDRLEFVDFKVAMGSEFFPLRKRRDESARLEYRKMLEDDMPNGLYIRDLMKETGGQKQ